MSEVEMSVAEQLKGMMDAQVSEKADKADLEGMVKTEALEAKADRADLEGMVKAADLDEVKSAQVEAIEAAKAEIREEMEAKMAATSPVIYKGAAPMEFKDFNHENGAVVKRLNLDLTKAVPGNNAAVGATDPRSVGSNATYHTLEQFNPFRAQATVLNVSGGSIRLPNVTGVEFTSDSTVQTQAQLLARDTSAVVAKNVIIENWVSQMQFSRPSLEDIDGIRNTIAGLIVQKYSVAQAKDAAAVLKTQTQAATAGAGKVVWDVEPVTGTQLPINGANIVGILSDLLATCDVAYRTNGVFMVSSNVFAKLTESSIATGGGMVFDPTTGISRVFGYPVMINGYLDDGILLDGTAVPVGSGKVAAYFGDFSRGLAICERKGLAIDEYDQTAPGFNTYYADGRFKNSGWDDAALVGLEVIHTVA
jgi:HK97 family phage major capsid protein